MDENRITEFKTPIYHGAWIPFDGDRSGFRVLVQEHLRHVLNDPSGRLVFENGAPQWLGKESVCISYAHTEGEGVLIYSKSTAVGVDIERRDRVFTQAIDQLVERFFHPNEIKKYVGHCSPEQFLDLWTKKESYAKYSLLGLSKTVQIELEKIEGVRFKPVPLSPSHLITSICFTTPPRR